jgi:hypothetical protein
MSIVIGKRNEGIAFMKGRFMHATHGPLPGSLQATADTLTTRKIEPFNNTTLIPRYELDRTI